MINFKPLASAPALGLIAGLGLTACQPAAGERESSSRASTDDAIEVNLPPRPQGRVDYTEPAAPPPPRLQVRAPVTHPNATPAAPIAVGGSNPNLSVRPASGAPPTPSSLGDTRARTSIDANLPSGLPAPVASIAYAYNYALAIPKGRGAEMMSRHEQACASAGPGFCQIVASRADWTSNAPSGRLQIQGQPEWINRFRSGLAVDARTSGGNLEASVTEGEDVTRNLDRTATGTETSATVISRIRELQAQRGVSPAQKLEIERELAQLQRHLDEQQVALRELNTRVQTARLTIDYRQGGVFAATSPTRPVAQALRDAFALAMSMLAMLIRLTAAVAPICVIVALIWWTASRNRARAVAKAAAT